MRSQIFQTQQKEELALVVDLGQVFARELSHTHSVVRRLNCHLRNHTPNYIPVKSTLIHSERF